MNILKSMEANYVAKIKEQNKIELMMDEGKAEWTLENEQKRFA